MTDSSFRYYDDYWSDEGFKPAGQSAGRDLRRLLAAHAAPGSVVVEVGCGDGAKIGNCVTAIGGQYRGFDVSRRAVELARSNGLNAGVIGDASELPVDDRSADVVVCAEVLEHLLDPTAALLEARRVLKQTGRIILTVPNIAYWRNRMDLALFGRWHPGGDDLSVSAPWRDPHIRFFTLSAVSSMLQQAALEPTLIIGAHEPSLFVRVPGLRRLVNDRRSGLFTRALAKQWPSLLGYQIYAVAGVAPR